MVDAISYKSFDRDTSKLRKVPVYNSKTDFSQKPETIQKANVFKNENVKKAAFGLLALTGAVIGAFLASKKGKQFIVDFKNNRILSKADKIIKKANSITKNADTEYQNAMKIMQSAEYGKFSKYSTSANFEDNVAKYQTFIIAGNSAVKVSASKADKETNLDITLLKGFRGTPKKYSAVEAYNFSNKNLTSFGQGVSEKKGKYKASKLFNFKEGKLFQYQEGLKEAEKSSSTRKQYIFLDDKLKTFRKNLKVGELESKVKETVQFNNDGTIERQGNLKMQYDPEEKTLNTNV